MPAGQRLLPLALRVEGPAGDRPSPRRPHERVRETRWKQRCGILLARLMRTMRRQTVPAESDLIPYQPGFPPGRRWLVLAPHGDDETLGPGGTLALAACRGVSVQVVILTDGAAQGDPAVRNAEVCAAVQALGLPVPQHLAFPDRALADSIRDLESALEGLIAEHEPDTVLVTSPIELHIDHRATALALQRALRRRPSPGWVAAYEVSAALRPNLLVDITAVWGAKERAVACYGSQLAVLPYHRVMAGLAVFRALTLDGVEYAEAFHVLPAHQVAAMRASSWASMMGSAAGVVGFGDQFLRRLLVRLRLGRNRR